MCWPTPSATRTTPIKIRKARASILMVGCRSTNLLIVPAASVGTNLGPAGCSTIAVWRSLRDSARVARSECAADEFLAIPGLSNGSNFLNAHSAAVITDRLVQIRLKAILKLYRAVAPERSRLQIPRLRTRNAAKLSEHLNRLGRQKPMMLFKERQS